eukprot:6131290-Amphidinium_carterae.1
MSAVSVFNIESNRLRGTLPESGLRTMRAIGFFNAGKNSFGGALPDAWRGFSMLEVWMVDFNDFEGQTSHAYTNGNQRQRGIRLFASACDIRLQMTFDSVPLNRCNTLIIGCQCGAPRQQLVGGVNSTPVAWRQEVDPKDRDSQRLRVAIKRGQHAFDFVTIAPRPLGRSIVLLDPCQFVMSVYDSWDGFYSCCLLFGGVAFALSSLVCGSHNWSGQAQ